MKLFKNKITKIEYMISNKEHIDILLKNDEFEEIKIEKKKIEEEKKDDKKEEKNTEKKEVKTRGRKKGDSK